VIDSTLGIEGGHLIRVAPVECLNPSGDELARAHQATILFFYPILPDAEFGPFRANDPYIHGTRFCRI
jgi:hypothetical protein